MALTLPVVERLIVDRCRRLLHRELLHGYYVLVVDDDPDTRLVCEVALTACGATIATADSAPAALALIDVSIPDCVVAGIPMPERDAYRLVDALRRRPRPIPVLAMANAAPGRLVGEILAGGFAGLLSKPFDPAELCTAVAVLNGGQWSVAS